MSNIRLVHVACPKLYDRMVISTACCSHSNRLCTIPYPSFPSIYLVESKFRVLGFLSSARRPVLSAYGYMDACDTLCKYSRQRRNFPKLIIDVQLGDNRGWLAIKVLYYPRNL